MSVKENTWVIARKEDIEKCHVAIYLKKDDTVKLFHGDSILELLHNIKPLLESRDTEIITAGIRYKEIIQEPDEELF